MQAVVTVVAVEEEVAAAVVAAVAVEAEAAVGAAVAVAAAAAGPEMTMMKMRTTTVHLLVDQVRPGVEPDEGFSTIKKWNSNWPKSCKINARWLRDDESPVSRPPIPSQPRIRTDAALP